MGYGCIFLVFQFGVFNIDTDISSWRNLEEEERRSWKEEERRRREEKGGRTQKFKRISCCWKFGRVKRWKC